MRLKLVKDVTTIDFLGMRRLFLSLSAGMIVLSIISLLAFGLNFGIDFRGGVLVEARLEKAEPISSVREVLGGLDLGDIAVQEFGDANTILARVERQEGGGNAQQAAVGKVSAALQEAFPGTTIRRSEVVGPKVSGELVERGVTAVILAVLAVLFYIWLRFEWQFSVGAVAALVHDVIITLGIFSLLGLEFNLSIIAALLTIVGYSLNDTVVVYDRIRENLRRYKTTELAQVLNMSINETLSRTLMTSVTTLIALLALYFLGGEVIRGFTFAMILGVVIGTYSSISIATPVLLWLGVKRDWDNEADKESKAGVQFG
ncbi:MAG: protein translocase subunit SecF [Neomegalonema sp.]|nr:protein translocase subunit SecF [Neomegalonema sp.]